MMSVKVENAVPSSKSSNRSGAFSRPSQIIYIYSYFYIYIYTTCSGTIREVWHKRNQSSE